MEVCWASRCHQHFLWWEIPNVYVSVCVSVCADPAFTDRSRWESTWWEPWYSSFPFFISQSTYTWIQKQHHAAFSSALCVTSFSIIEVTVKKLWLQLCRVWTRHVLPEIIMFQQLYWLISMRVSVGERKWSPLWSSAHPSHSQPTLSSVSMKSRCQACDTLVDAFIIDTVYSSLIHWGIPRTSG